MKRSAGFQDLRTMCPRDPSPWIQEADRRCSLDAEDEVKRNRPSTDDEEGLRAELGLEPPLDLLSHSFVDVWAFPLALDAPAGCTQKPRVSVVVEPCSPEAMVHMFDGWSFNAATAAACAQLRTVSASVDDDFDSSEEGDCARSWERPLGLATPETFGSPAVSFHCPRRPATCCRPFLAAPAPMWIGVPVNF